MEDSCLSDSDLKSNSILLSLLDVRKLGCQNQLHMITLYQLQGQVAQIFFSNRQTYCGRLGAEAKSLAQVYPHWCTSEIKRFRNLTQAKALITTCRAGTSKRFWRLAYMDSVHQYQAPLSLRERLLLIEVLRNDSGVWMDECLDHWQDWWVTRTPRSGLRPRLYHHQLLLCSRSLAHALCRFALHRSLPLLRAPQSLADVYQHTPW